MGIGKELDIKNKTDYFFNEVIDIRNFQSNLLKIDKNHYKNFDIYYIGYIIITLYLKKLMIMKIFVV